MLQLHNLESTNKKRNRKGRGGSRGGTSGRGHKGQRARTGGKSELGAVFEGGQMPLTRRLPCRGFNNSFKTIYDIVNIADLEKLFKDGETVNLASLRKVGLFKGRDTALIKVLSTGELTKKLIVEVNAYSKSAIEKINKVGGVAKLQGA